MNGDRHAGASVVVVGRDVSGVDIREASPIEAPVGVRAVASAGQRPEFGFASILEQATFGFAVMLFGDQNSLGYGLGTGVIDDTETRSSRGGFVLHAQTSERYPVVTNVQPPWYVSSITSDGHDLTLEPYWSVGERDVAPIEVELRSDGGAVCGVVRHEGAPTAAFLYALPTFASTTVVRMTIAQGDGVYCLKGLAPGGYRVLAFDHEVAIPFREDVAGWLGRGRAVAVGAGSRAEVDLDFEP